MPQLDFMRGQGRRGHLVGHFVYYDTLWGMPPAGEPDMAQHVTEELAAFKDLYTGAEAYEEVASYLQQLADNEREKELEVLRQFFGVDLTQEYNSLNLSDFYSVLIRSYNSVLNLKPVFERIVTKMKYLDETIKPDKTGYKGVIVDPYFIANKFYDKVNKNLTNTQFLSKIWEKAKVKIEADTSNSDDIIGRCFIEALRPEADKMILEAAIETFEGKVFSDTRTTSKLSESEREEIENKYKDAYSEVLKELYAAQTILKSGGTINNPIIEGFKRIYNLDNMFEQISQVCTEGITAKSKQVKKKSIKQIPTNYYSQGGNMSEVVDNIVTQCAINLSTIPGVQVKASHTGPLQMKPDQIIVSVDLPDPVELLKTVQDYRDFDAYNHPVNIGSPYVKNAIRMRNYQEEIARINQELGNSNKALVIYESEKTSVMGTHFDKMGGFSAGSPMSMRTLSDYLREAGLGTITNYSTLIGAIINTAKHALFEGRANQNAVRLALSQAFASFLFDDVKTIGKELADATTIDAIHIMRLNQVVVPLSFFLQGAADSLRGAVGQSLQDFVSVHLHVPALLYYGPPVGTGYAKWTSQRDYAMDNTTITINFGHKFKQLMNDFQLI